MDTLGGEIDVVADPQLVTTEPVAGGILSGDFLAVGPSVKAGVSMRLCVSSVQSLHEQTCTFRNKWRLL